MKNFLASLLLASTFTLVATRSSAQFTLSVGVTVRTPPPALPVYTQPPCPVEGYLWTPGYWAYDEIDGYYWVPGVWLRPAQPGFLWTPGYWGYVGGVYGWHGGYWGPHIGFYGGVNYGYGYGGVGFVGGQWQGGYFHYNTAVTNVNTTVIHNTYVNNTVVNNTTINNTTVNNRASFNGGAGTQAQPTANERTAMNENHVQPTDEQLNHNHTASMDRNQFASANGGHPGTTTMNSVGGARFNPQGRNAPSPVARPAGRMGAGATANNHPVQPAGGHMANAGGEHPNNHPAANRPTANHPGANHPGANRQPNRGGRRQ